MRTRFRCGCLSLHCGAYSTGSAICILSRSPVGRSVCRLAGRLGFVSGCILGRFRACSLCFPAFNSLCFSVACALRISFRYRLVCSIALDVFSWLIRVRRLSRRGFCGRRTIVAAVRNQWLRLFSRAKCAIKIFEREVNRAEVNAAVRVVGRARTFRHRHAVFTGYGKGELTRDVGWGQVLRGRKHLGAREFHINGIGLVHISENGATVAKARRCGQTAVTVVDDRHRHGKA